jgi:hypothetical protein
MTGAEARKDVSMWLEEYGTPRRIWLYVTAPIWLPCLVITCIFLGDWP